MPASSVPGGVGASLLSLTRLILASGLKSFSQAAAHLAGLDGTPFLDTPGLGLFPAQAGCSAVPVVLSFYL